MLAALPDFATIIVVEIDASSVAMAIILSQEGYPFDFFSMKMCLSMQASLFGLC